MHLRAVRFDPACDEAAEQLGGYESIDRALLIHVEALERNPKAFPKVEDLYGSVRYISTKAFGQTPALIWYFVIEASGDVLITHVEKLDP